MAEGTADSKPSGCSGKGDCDDVSFDLHCGRNEIESKLTPPSPPSRDTREHNICITVEARARSGRHPIQSVTGTGDQRSFIK